MDDCLWVPTHGWPPMDAHYVDCESSGNIYWHLQTQSWGLLTRREPDWGVRGRGEGMGVAAQYWEGTELQ